ncbi:MAG: ImcF-related family protein [Polyangiaceae bacterium]
MEGLVALTAGMVFAGDFRVVRPLSAGGMGAVYVVQQISTNKPRALKIMRADLVANDDLRRRFEQEARVGADIASDHVVEVIAAGVDAQTGMPWLAMELLSGRDLETYARSTGPVPFHTFASLFQQLGHALTAAHDMRIVHRDLKPENIYLADSRRADGAFTVKILDFGIAKTLADAKTRLTAAVGTPLWMAPEQSSPTSTLGPAADVWALGLIAFRLLVGKVFWVSAHHPEASTMMIMREVLMDPVPAASARAAQLGTAAQLPPGFDGWFARCVERDPTRRFQDARQAMQGLAAMTGAGVAPPALAPPDGRVASATPSVPVVVTDPGGAVRAPPTALESPSWSGTARPPETRLGAPHPSAYAPFPTPGAAAPPKRTASPSRTGLFLGAGILVLAGVVTLVVVLVTRSSGDKKKGAPAWTAEFTEKVKRIDWADPVTGFKLLDEALTRLRDGDPGPEVPIYLAKVADAFVKVEEGRLRDELARTDDDPSRYLRNRELLKAYLMLTEPNGAHPHLDVAASAETFAASWCQRLKQSVGATELCTATAKFPRGHVQPHLEYYFENAKANRTSPPTRDEQLVESVRRSLSRIPRRARYYALFVESLGHEKFDPTGEEVPENLVLPPVSLPGLFKDRPIVGPATNWLFDSRRRIKEQKPYEVSGVYTDRGRVLVYVSLRGAEDLLKEDDWAFPLDDEEKRSGEILQTLKALEDDYQRRFMKEWDQLLDDVVVRSPTDVDGCLAILEELTRSEYPFARLLGAIGENTRASSTDPFAGRGIGTQLNSLLRRRLVSASGEWRVAFDIGKMNASFSFISQHFESLTAFVLGRAKGPADHIRYLDVLKDLQKQVATRKRETAGLELVGMEAELEAARTKTMSLLASSSYDPFAVGILKALLLAPLTQATRSSEPQPTIPKPLKL